MMIGTKEHYDLLNMFERSIAKHHRKEREDKSLWKKGVIYQDGNVPQSIENHQSPARAESYLLCGLRTH